MTSPVALALCFPLAPLVVVLCGAVLAGVATRLLGSALDVAQRMSRRSPEQERHRQAASAPSPMTTTS